MKALFIGQSYIDITFLTDEHADRRREDRGARLRGVVRRQRGHGGVLLRQARHCAGPDLTSVADDWLGRMFIDMAAKYGISVHHRKVAESSLSFIMPKGDQRAIVRCRDDNFQHPFPVLNLAGCRALHVDGHLRRRRDPLREDLSRGRHPDLARRRRAALEHARAVWQFIDVAVVAERLCEQMQLTPGEMLTYLRSRGCKIGGVTMGAQGHALVRRDAHASASCPRSACRTIA